MTGNGSDHSKNIVTLVTESRVTIAVLKMPKAVDALRAGDISIGVQIGKTPWFRCDMP